MTEEIPIPPELLEPPKRRLASWTQLEVIILIALAVCVVSLSVVTIATDSDTAAESGLRGVVLLLAGALVGIKVRNGK